MSPSLSCTSCGSVLPAASRPDSGYCPHCGVALAQSTPIPTPVPPAPGGNPPAPPRRNAPPPPVRGGGQTSESEPNPFLTPENLDDRTPPIPMAADGVVSSVRPEVLAEQPVNQVPARPAVAPGHPSPPRPPSPKVHPAPPTPASQQASSQQNSPQAAGPFGTASAEVVAPAASAGAGVAHAPQSAGQPLIQRGGYDPGIKDVHAEFRKGSGKGKVFAVLAVAALAALFFFLPGGEEKSASLDAEPNEKAIIGTSNSPEIIEEPEKDFSKKVRPEPMQEGSSSATANEGNFAESFKSKAK